MKKFILIFALIISSFAYSTQIAHDMAYLAEVAYESLDKINAWSCSVCSSYPVKNQKAFYVSGPDIQGYVAYYSKENAVIIAYRGSVDFVNWMMNLDTAAVGYSGCSGCAVHQGFYQDFKKTIPTVRPLVASLLSAHSGAKLIVTGHSLGGAMAIHTALDMKQIHGKVDYIYTFGQPRIGNQAFANFYIANVPNTYRVINYADMVPHVPPLSLNFRHSGHEQWYNPRGMSKYKECASEDTSCADSIPATSLSTDDHQLTNYMKLAVSSNMWFEQDKMRIPLLVENLRKSKKAMKIIY